MPDRIRIPAVVDPFIQARGHAIEICGPETGHSVKAVAYCDSTNRAFLLAHRFKVHDELLEALEHLLDDVDNYYDGDDRSITLDITADRARAVLAKAQRHPEERGDD